MKNMKIFLLIIISALNLYGQKYAPLDSVISSHIQNKIFPGASILIGTADSILYNNFYGNFTYDSVSPEVDEKTMFDLASVTKAFGTNFCAMKLYDEGKLNLYKTVASYIPEFGRNGKDKVKVIDLIVHESGLQAYYTPKQNQTRDDIIDTIYSLPLSYETNTKMVYSCVNFVTTMLVIESIINEPMYKFYTGTFTEPLGMNHTMFTPPADLKANCIPAQAEIQGVVHDPLARGLNGLSGNAGLFSTAADLAKLCQLLLNDGTWNEEKILSAETIKLFRTRYSEESGRALGFDTRSDEGYSASGKYFSKGTFGHTGYTGTSIWIDPIKKVFIIFLTNRTYPDDSASISRARPEVYDTAMKCAGFAD